MEDRRNGSFWWFFNTFIVAVAMAIICIMKIAGAPFSWWWVLSPMIICYGYQFVIILICIWVALFSKS